MSVEKGIATHKDECDGCGEKIPPGSPLLTGIDSCCGACSRKLCVACVERAAILLGLIVKEEKT